MLCRQPRLLICDEASSALDSNTEREIMASLEVGSAFLCTLCDLSNWQLCFLLQARLGALAQYKIMTCRA